MEIKILFLLILSVTFLSLLNCQEEGDRCPGGRPGVCTRVQDCASALRRIKLRIKPQLCSFKDRVPIICCKGVKRRPKLRGWMLPRSNIGKVSFASRKTTTPAAEPKFIFKNGVNLEDCPPVPFNLTAPKIGQKAFDKCLYYQEQYLYPCVESPLLGQNKTRADFCTWNPESLIINGRKASRGEFPHMVKYVNTYVGFNKALLGFGTTTIDWKCGGIIVSPRFVLTAAHCIKSSLSGPVTKIKIGILNRSEPDSRRTVYDVQKIHVHKGYHAPQKYNDIALLETDREMVLNPLALPACLHDGSPVNDTEVIVTGWGTTKIGTVAPADNLQKAFLTKFQDFECIAHQKRFKNRNLLRGIDSETQMCFGDKTDRTDTCDGDSGGPAQIRHPKVYCMYLVLGLTSYGRSCGHIGEPGVYTRVSHYLPWIESIVWP